MSARRSSAARWSLAFLFVSIGLVVLAGDRLGLAEAKMKAKAVAQAALRPNVPTDFNATVDTPKVDPTAYLDPMSSVLGNVELGPRVYVAPFASLRGDEGQPIRLGAESNVQDGVVIHALMTEHDGEAVPANSYEAADGKRWAVYLGDRVSLAHQAQVHGPAWIEDDVFVGMQALVFKSRVGKGVVIEPGAKVLGVTIPPGRYVPMGTILNKQADADALPAIDENYPFRELNKKVVHVNTSLADGYLGRAAPKTPAAPAAKP